MHNLFRVLIIEDEKPSADNLSALLKQIDPSIEIAGVTQSVEQTIEWLKNETPPALLFMDIQLNDGLSFALFDKVNITIPIIFTTGFDKYLVEAFEHNGIDYLLKPLNKSKVQKAVEKYRNLQSHFLHNYSALAGYLNQGRQKNRIAVKRGTELRSLRHEEVAYFFSENKVVFLVTRDNEKYMVNKPLRDLEKDLDPAVFYRISRKYIVNIDFVKKIKQLKDFRLQVEMTVPLQEPIIVSQESSSLFKTWMENL